MDIIAPLFLRMLPGWTGAALITVALCTFSPTPSLGQTPPAPSSGEQQGVGAPSRRIQIAEREEDSGEDEAPTADVAQREAEMFGTPEEDEAAADEDAYDDSARDAAIFGGSEEDVDEPAAAPDRDERFLGEEASTSSVAEEISAKLQDAEDELAIGGRLFTQLTYSIPEGTDGEVPPLDQHTLTAPNLVDLYLDARPNDRVRAYIRGRLTYNWALEQQSTQPSAADAFGGGDGADNMGQGDGVDVTGGDQSTLPFGLGAGGGFGGQRLQVQLDQLWVKFDLARTLYVTLGRQRIRWGAGRFWNPTDFLNANQINPVALFDQRLGVDLLKLHLPVESLGWNFYAIAQLGEANTLEDVGGALRGEFLLGTAELAVSVAARRQTFQGPTAITAPIPVGNDGETVDLEVYTPEQEWPKTSTPLRLGADLSTALGPFEVRLEGALVRGTQRPFYAGDFNLDFQNPGQLSFPIDQTRDDEWLPQVVASADISLEYGDSDQLIIAGEYFYNGQGYDSDEYYLWLALQGGLRPLYLGKHYAALALVLPAPGDLNDASFTLSTLSNLSDRSVLSRLDVSVTLITDLSLTFFGTLHYGERGEFFFREEFPATPGQEAPTVITTERFGCGTALSLRF